MDARGPEFCFDQVARLAAPGDNVAIMSRRLEAGTLINHNENRFRLPHTVPQGHRIAHTAIGEDQSLLSWGLPFGSALCDIEPGQYICNSRILEALAARHVDFDMPASPNFRDKSERYRIDEQQFVPGKQVERDPQQQWFDGYARSGGRGVGTRNYLVILGISSLAASYARALATRLKDVAPNYADIDGVVPIAHTEGGDAAPNNITFVLRALSGFFVHPNVGAVLAVDAGGEPVNGHMLQRFMAEHGYACDNVPQKWMSLADHRTLASALEEGEATLRRWLAPISAFTRSRQSIEHLKLALQCGGSDAFSGVSANPLAGAVAKQTIRLGGSANLAETDELIGAEQYILQNVRDLATAQAFLDTIESFEQRAGWHGHSAEGNPTGGNNFRGLYNIAIKSIGAARKKDPQVRLDTVIGYAEPMRDPGYYFMDSPGNDLESVAGQVASGANLILFTTGNGSITNFPFVPTIKIISTTERYNLIATDMDVNAGRYQDGEPWDDLSNDTFDLALRVASGQRSAGEKAGHSQVQLWRNWHQTQAVRHSSSQPTAPSGKPLVIKARPSVDAMFTAYRTETGYASDQVGLVVPTSLCSGQIAIMLVDTLNSRPRKIDAVSRFATVVHTEGCGVSGGDNEALYIRTLLGHAAHPMVRCALFLEHGCEKTHNDAMQTALHERGLDRSGFGWASVQLDGGIEHVIDKAVRWFESALSSLPDPVRAEAGLTHLRLGLTSTHPAAPVTAEAAAHLVAIIVASGGTVVVPNNTPLLTDDIFVDELRIDRPAKPTLAYGQCATHNGFHIMATPTGHTVETLAGLAATGVEVMLAHVNNRPIQAHPIVPLIQCATNIENDDMDAVLRTDAADAATQADHLLDMVLRVASRRYTPKLFGQGYTDFQMTRGLLGVSL